MDCSIAFAHETKPSKFNDQLCKDSMRFINKKTSLRSSELVCIEIGDIKQVMIISPAVMIGMLDDKSIILRLL